MEFPHLTSKQPRSEQLMKKAKASEQKPRAAKKQLAVHKRVKESTSQADTAIIEASPVPEAHQASPPPEASKHLYLLPGDNLEKFNSDFSKRKVTIGRFIKNGRL